jgi:phage terminase small subunit
MVAMATTTAPAPAPRHLSRRSKDAWREITTNYALTEKHHLMVLRIALEQADLHETARLEVEREGAFTVDRYGSARPHPAIRVMKDAAVISARMFRELSLGEGYIDDVRIPRPDGSRS